MSNQPMCNHETFDGNVDDPTFYYCDQPAAHAGPHHYSIEVTR